MASARRRKDCFTSFLFVLPLLTLFLVFFAYPIIYNIVISFYDWNGISVEKVFVGFANYKKLWADSVMQKTFRNFVIIAISTTVIQSALGLMLASFFHQKNKTFRII
ncbi:MAG: carbohydrate ABC transporter permease [Blautia faecis]